jgi:orotidine-5'-phosphate decarboxylase
MTAYLERLDRRIAEARTVLCLGIDPDPDGLPAGFSRDLKGVERLALLFAEAGAPHAAAVKPNLAFFEAFGSEGIAVLERVRRAVPSGIPVIADAKRGDIGSTAARQAVALFDALGADAVTASPYLGAEALAPLLLRKDGFVYVLCRTSNPGAGELQDLVVLADPLARMPAEPLHERVARRARGWSEQYGTVGLVVGATAPHELAAIRRVAPELPFLVPGVGTQGGDVAAVLEHGRASEGRAGRTRGGALLVNVSRGIASGAGVHPDPAEGIAAAAQAWAERLRV